MLQILTDVIKTTFLIAIPFTILYALFWIKLNQYLQKKDQYYRFDIETHPNKINISYKSTQGTNVFPTYNTSPTAYGSNLPFQTNHDNERQNNLPLSRKTSHRHKRFRLFQRRSKL